MARLVKLTILGVAMALLVNSAVARAGEWTLLRLNFQRIQASLMFSFLSARRWLEGTVHGDTWRSTRGILSLTGRRFLQRTGQARDRRTAWKLDVLAAKLPVVWLQFWKVWILVPSLWPVSLYISKPQEAADQNSNHFIRQFFKMFLSMAFSNLP